MAIRLQVASGGGDGVQASPVNAVFGSNVAVGNLLAVAVRDTNLNAVTLSDTLGTTYALAVSNTAQDPNLGLWYGIAPSSGANTVSATWGAQPTAFPWVYAVEYAGSWSWIGVVA